MILSIIIPLYKVERYVERCLRSCVEQNIPASEYEIIVVNDGSPDRSFEIAVEYATGRPNFKLISQDNAGQSAARNAGMGISSGKYLLFLDSDDRLAPDCLGKLIAELVDETPDVLAFCEADDINGEYRIRRRFPSSRPSSGKDFLRLGVEYCSKVTAEIWSADFLKKNGLRLCEGIFHEDIEFAPRAFYFAEKVSYFNEVALYVTVNPDSTTRSYNPKRSFDLIDAVCPNLSHFSMSVSGDMRHLFDRIISVCLNNAYDNIVSVPRPIQKEFNEAVSRKTGLFAHLSASGKAKYRVEAILFRLFPRHTVQVYKAMQLFNR